MVNGTVSYCQVRAITRYRGSNPDAHSALLDAAVHGHSVSDLERLVRRAKQLDDDNADDRGGDGKPAAWERLGMRDYSQYDGLHTIDLTVQPDDAARLLAAVDAKVRHDYLFPVDSRESDLTDRITSAERRLHALLDLVDAGVARLAEDGHIDPERAAINVMVDYDRLFRDAQGGACETSSGLPLTGEAARRLACDAGYHRIITQGRSLVLDVGTKTRVWNAAQRRAIRAKYGWQCAVPACANRITQIHHAVPVEQGGETNLIFGIPFCGCHHHLVHEGGWWVTVDIATGHATLESPDGRTIELPIHTYDLFNNPAA